TEEKYEGSRVDPGDKRTSAYLRRIDLLPNYSDLVDSLYYVACHVMPSHVVPSSGASEDPEVLIPEASQPKPPLTWAQGVRQTQYVTVMVVNRLVVARPGDLHLTRMRRGAMKLPFPKVVWGRVLGFIAQRDYLRSQVRTITRYEFVREEGSTDPRVGQVH